MVKAPLFLFLAAGMGYFLFYPFIRNSVSRKLLVKWFLVIYGIVMLISTVNTFFMKRSTAGGRMNIDDIVGIAGVDSTLLCYA